MPYPGGATRETTDAVCGVSNRATSDLRGTIPRRREGGWSFDCRNPKRGALALETRSSRVRDPNDRLSGPRVHDTKVARHGRSLNPWSIHDPEVRSVLRSFRALPLRVASGLRRRPTVARGRRRPPRAADPLVQDVEQREARHDQERGKRDGDQHRRDRARRRRRLRDGQALGQHVVPLADAPGRARSPRPRRSARIRAPRCACRSSRTQRRRARDGRQDHERQRPRGEPVEEVAGVGPQHEDADERHDARRRRRRPTARRRKYATMSSSESRRASQTR